MFDYLTSDEKLWQQRCRTFAQEVVAPQQAQCDREARFPHETHRRAHDEGLIDVDIPEDLGGRGVSPRRVMLWAEEVGRVCAPTALSLAITSAALQPILQGGTSEQKQVFIRNTLNRRDYASLCFTEPNQSGSALFEAQTRAVRTDDGWVIDGEKCMVGNAPHASLFIVFAQTIIGGDKTGYSLFAVPRGDGVRVDPDEVKIGFRCLPTPTVHFEQVRVPNESLIGEPGVALTLLPRVFAQNRFVSAAAILGITVGALEEVLPWAEKRQITPRERLIEKSHVRVALGDLYTEVWAVRCMIAQIAEALADGRDCSTLSTMAKLRASQLAVRATNETIQMFGWRGLTAMSGIEKRLRDARMTTVYAGTTEVHQLNIFNTMVQDFLSDKRLA